ncbi:hypothetical protein F5144DRAFT_634011 [Chaetomium tenue]|uniref:Uncharacterized protein n=1 Tax=Chaetomium tenue TaxID=1854479 RepID=A0ACB7NX84_9PEZI|nr:hypothetical protein F5144DRAFT_634011 [Chaetomium globosum]
MTTLSPPQSPITIRLPSKYTTTPTDPPPPTTPTPFTPPPLPFLQRTWTVTHSTLKMWRSARNVRITYGALPPSPSPSTSPSIAAHRARVSDTVEYEARSGRGGVKRIAGVDTAAVAGDAGVWDWRGSGWLFFVGSHWEVLGWGERVVPREGAAAGVEAGVGDEGEVEMERWVVTWFAPTVFTAEGVDVYSDRRGGASEGLVKEVLAELGRVCEGKGKLGEIVGREMKEVAINLPWKE